MFPRHTHAVKRAGSKILNQDVALLDQRVEHLFALGLLGIEGDRALVVIEHREVQTVRTRHIAQLATCCVAFARALNLDDIRAHPREQLSTGGTRLNVREIEDADAV